MMALFKIALTFFAIALIVFGVIASVSPVPFGFVFIVLGLLLLAVVAPTFMRFFRKRWRWFDRQLDRLQEKLPNWIGRRLKASDIDHDEEDEDEDEENQNSGGKIHRASHRR